MEKQLMDAVNRLEIREIISLLERGAKPSTCLADGTPILHLMVGGERMPLQEEIAELLLSYGSCVNKQAQDGSTALHVAASWGRMDMIYLLVCNGADVDMQDEEGYTPADVAAFHKHQSCEKWLRSCSTALVMESSIFYMSQMEETETDEEEDETILFVETPEISYGEEVEEQDGEDDSSCSEVPSAILQMTNKELREALKTKGVDPGPFSASTKPLYGRYLHRLEQGRAEASNSKHSFPNVLSQTLLSQSLPEMSDIEEQLRQSFAGREDWREGILKTAFNYIIIDPRQLPDDFLERSKRDLELCHKIESFKQFIESIFYVGKGKRSRPYQHLREAITDKASKKVARIRDIWSDDRGVVSLHIFQSAIPVEAYTREACMIAALGLSHLTNVQRGQVYGIACTWSQNQLQKMGVFYLYRAFCILLSEGLSEIKLRHFKS